MRLLEVAVGLGLGWCVLTGLPGCGGVVDPSGQGGSPASGGSAGTGGSSGTGIVGGASSAHPCESACFEKVRTGTVASCKLCHAAQPAPAGLQSSGLDLESPNVTARLKDVPAKHADIVFMGTIGSMVPGCPVSDKLVDTQAPANSWLLKKVSNQQGTCGTQMPQPPTTLRPDELACVESYVYCVAGQMPP